MATGVYESDMGLWAPDAGKLLRYRRQLNAENVAVFMNITPEFASSAGDARHRDDRTFRRGVPVLPTRSSSPVRWRARSRRWTRSARRSEGCGDETPVFANTGVKSTNVRDFLAVADGAIVGSDLKVDGGTWNPVDPDRASRFMAEVRAAREYL